MLQEMKRRGRKPNVEVFATQEQMDSATFPDLLASKGLVEPLRELSRLSYGPVIDWAFEAYNHFNKMFWNGRLPVIPITVAITPHGRCIGKMSFPHDVPRIALHPSVEHPQAWDLGDRATWHYAALVLLHEMIHVAESTIYAGLPNPGETSHNQDIWMRETNRLSEAVGLPAVCTRVKPKRIGNRVVRVAVEPPPFPLSMDQISRWPHGIAEAIAESNGEDVKSHVAAWQLKACEMLSIPSPDRRLRTAKVT
jgi:hypothetical protein